jgi:hypothetical protein
MDTKSRRMLILELEDGEGDSLAGRITSLAGNGIQFVGWLGLAGAIEAALQGDHADEDSKPAQGGFKR